MTENNNQRERRKSAPYTETTFETTIIEIQEKLDKNTNYYWIIRTGEPIFNNSHTTYLAFSNDYDLNPKTKNLLKNNRFELENKEVRMVVKKNKYFDERSGEERTSNKVILIELLEKIQLDSNYEPVNN